MSALLTVEGIEVAYGDMIAVADARLEVRGGENVCLIGANGAGKTTVLRAINGLLPLRRGRIEFEGERIDGLPPSKIVRRGIAHVPEARQLFPTMTVRENLELGSPPELARKGQALERVFHLFPRLKERASQAAGTLSGGEQQMVAIGRGLMAQPRLLMLDEPSLGLAPLMVRLIFDTVRSINTSGTTILLVEQNVARALELSHRGYVIENGRIGLDGACDALRSNPHVKRMYLGV